ncbi:MAG: CHRD domain-containing protein [Rhodospirillaceae bacterium]|nr:CHRD domain-containing protein [Rhodospirillaceae bacterium]
MHTHRRPAQRLPRRRGAAILAVGALACAVLISAAQVPETFTARLSVMPIDRVLQTHVAGSGSGAAVLDGGRLRISGAFSGLRGPATAAWLHESPAMGVRGAALFELTVAGGVQGTFSGEVELSGEQLAGLHQGRLYIQIHSEAAPEGNLWGWLLR